jgi:hypothetical protein
MISSLPVSLSNFRPAGEPTFPTLSPEQYRPPVEPNLGFVGSYALANHYIV